MRSLSLRIDPLFWTGRSQDLKKQNRHGPEGRRPVGQVAEPRKGVVAPLNENHSKCSALKLMFCDLYMILKPSVSSLHSYNLQLINVFYTVNTFISHLQTFRSSWRAQALQASYIWMRHRWTTGNSNHVTAEPELVIFLQGTIMTEHIINKRQIVGCHGMGAWRCWRLWRLWRRQTTGNSNKYRFWW